MIVLIAFPGVPIFFFISGFLISAAYERNPDLKKFALNRALRIFPGLWVCLIVSIASVILIYPCAFAGISFKDLFFWLIAQVSFFQFYNPDFLRSYGLGALNGSLWTIAVEFQFYFLIPIVYFFIRIKATNSKLILSALIGVFLFLQVAYTSFILGAGLDGIVHKILGVSFIPYLWLFLLGVYVQRSYEQLSVFFENRVLHWSLLHLLSVIFALSIGEPHGNNFPYPLAAISLCGLALAGAYSYKGLADKILKQNDISYGIYIYHGIILNAIIHMNWKHSLWSLSLLILLAVVCGWLSWRIIERPSLLYKSTL